jgi:hypothetical protein
MDSRCDPKAFEPTIKPPSDLSANGAAHASPGQRPGNAAPWQHALNGRHKRCHALSGLGMFLAIDPRAMPFGGSGE